ncbi:hypothetical protein SALBM135S_02950 [Streptomyces alboniger]
MRPGSRALRVDVIGRRLSVAGLLRDFHRAHPGTDLDVVTLLNADTAIAAVRSGMIDATFRAVTLPGHRLPDGIEATPVLDEPLHLFTGPSHEFATADAVAPAQLAGRRIWMPGNMPGTEWSAYYDEPAATLPHHRHGQSRTSASSTSSTRSRTPTLATFIGEQTPLVSACRPRLATHPPASPTPVYPHPPTWHTHTRHPALAALRHHLGSAYSGRPDSGV